MTTPTAPPRRSATRREGNGRLESASEMIDMWFDAWIQALNAQRSMFKSGLDLFAPLYSAVDEAQHLTRGAMRSADE